MSDQQQRGRGRRPQRRDYDNEFDNEVIEIRRVAKVVKGGKNMSFRTTVIVGDRKGKVGIGKGNTQEIPRAVQQGIRAAKGNMIEVPLIDGRTIPHAIEGRFKAARVVLKPAFPGTGVTAGGTVAAICRMAGIRDILTKSMGSNNPLTLAKATLQGLSQLRTVNQVAKMRDKDVKEILHAEA